MKYYFHYTPNPIKFRIRYTKIDTMYATAHWRRTIRKAHFPPNSLFMEATAATHGVYKRQNTKRDAAPDTVMDESNADVEP